MQIVLGAILIIVAAGMLFIGRPSAGTDSARWLARPWILGQVYVLGVLLVTVVGVALILNGWPA
jgi:hypothetical protein